MRKKVYVLMSVLSKRLTPGPSPKERGEQQRAK
jgi:hypothetical protein